jgi:hypothetical protein
MASYEPRSLNKCSDDVLVEIFHICLLYPTTLVNLCQVSKRLQSLCTPLLYHCVDVSFHDDEEMRRRVINFNFGPEYDPEPSKLKQLAFLRTLNSRPEYGRLIRSLKWTLQWNTSDIYVDNSCKWELPDIEYSTWSVFSSLINVQTLDLGCVNEFFVPFMHENLNTLFPNARHVRIFGNMHLGLVSSILHTGDPSRFYSLSLDDLQDVGQYPNGIPIDPDDHGTELHRIRESTNSDGTRGLVFPGPMRTVLKALYGRCTSLKSLVLNKFGLEISDDQSRNWPEEMHASVYAEYSDFLTSKFRKRPTRRISL